MKTAVKWVSNTSTVDIAGTKEDQHCIQAKIEHNDIMVIVYMHTIYKHQKKKLKLIPFSYPDTQKCARKKARRSQYRIITRFSHKPEKSLNKMKAKVRTALEIKSLLYCCDPLSFVCANSKCWVRINYRIICRVRINKLTDQMCCFPQF